MEIKEITEDLEKIDARDGLEEEIFLAVSTLVPIANVDLLVLDEKGRMLLSWREDEYFGTGWHIPGGCIRFKETMEERIQRTAIAEIGSEVIIDGPPITVREVILDKERKNMANQNHRAHQLAVLYLCHLPREFKIDNGERSTKDKGYLKWFDHYPENMLKVHSVYDDILKTYGFKREE